MNIYEELYELENFEGSGFSNFVKDHSKKFIIKVGTKAVEKAVNTGSTAVGEKFGTLIANKIVGPKSSSSNSVIESNNNSNEIPMDSGYKIIKLLQQKPESIRTQFNSI